jgi:hypothetical protein
MRNKIIAFTVVLALAGGVSAGAVAQPGPPPPGAAMGPPPPGAMAHPNWRRHHRWAWRYRHCHWRHHHRICWRR